MAVKKRKPVKPRRPQQVAYSDRPGRRFDNGMLKVGRVTKIKKNAEQSPLLRLPAEVRNQIWELVLGGNTFDIVYTADVRYCGLFTTKIRDMPENCFALLQTRRQIFTEANLFPYQSNVFASADIHCFDWFRELPLFGQKSITEIGLHICIGSPTRMYSAFGRYSGSILRAGEFPSKLLQGLRRVVINRPKYTYQSKGWREREEERLVKHIRKGRGKIEIVIEDKELAHVFTER